jgi:TRAP-type C4-dicarboxylate transport system substrate-binding protein
MLNSIPIQEKFMQKTTLNWVLAHEPYHVFIKAAKSFAAEVSAETNGKYNINVVSLTEWNEIAKTNLTNHTTDREKIIELIDNGTIDLATVYASTLGKIDKDINALAMPFLFNDHDEASNVIDGQIGQHLLSKISKSSNIRGLAFTYSGGFKIIPSTQAIETLNDFYQLNLSCTNNAVSIGTIKAIGANPVPLMIEDIAKKLATGEIAGGETTYTRYFILEQDKYTKYINDNEHSLFLTSLVINEQLWQSLGSEVQQVFANAAMRAAKIEREDSLADNLIVETQAFKQGIETIKMTSKEKAKFVNATKGLYSALNGYFSAGLLDQIINGKNK